MIDINKVWTTESDVSKLPKSAVMSEIYSVYLVYTLFNILINEKKPKILSSKKHS